jgi:hypothetical protein
MDAYKKHRSNQAEKSRDQSTEARDIGPPPKCKNKKRRDSCERDLRKYLLTYYPESFPLPFSEDHERILLEIQSKALEGGLKAIAMSRGSGKTTILLRAINWVLSYGHRRFAVLVEADEGAAEESMDTIKIEWETNDLLLEDFPEIAYPIRCLEGITQRGNAQTSGGNRTLIGWRRKELIFPTIANSKASGATVRCSGILGRIRGMNKATADGKTIRPDFILVNDPQTDASATSEVECAKRERVMGGAILGLGGPGKRIAGFAAVTVIREGDVADRLLNRKIMPKWHGDRCKLVYEWPTDKEHWAKYLEIRAEEIDAGDDEHPKANAYYKKHRTVMDAGSRVGWSHRKFAHELSAIQHAVNLRADNPDTYDAEYDNTPRTITIASGDLELLTSDQYCLRVLPTHRRGELPNWVEHLCVGIDVQGSSLWWSMVGIGQDFSAIVTDYGVWPEQGIDYVSLKEIDRTIASVTKIKQPAESLIEGLRQITGELFSRRLTRDDGAEIKVGQCMVDAGYQSEAVYRFAQETGLSIMPSHGRGVTAKERPWNQSRRKAGERMGFGWRIPPTKGVRAPRYVLIDTNEWKTLLARCWSTPLGEPGAWTLYRSPPLRHRMIADNLSAEYPVATEGQGRKLYEWANRPGRDNHLHDATLLAAVGASIAGVAVPGQAAGRITQRRHVSLSQRSPQQASPQASTRLDPSSGRVAGGEGPKPKATARKKTMAELRAERRAS